MGVATLRWVAALLVAAIVPPAASAADARAKEWCERRLLAPFDKVDPQRNFALSLSGGGYRAMLYHIGTLRRLNESGLLAELAVVSSVSGGSITAGMLAKAWRELEFESKEIPAPLGVAGASPVVVRVATNFEKKVAEPLTELAASTIDVPAVIAGFFPFASAADSVASSYDRIYEGALLSEVAAPMGGPVFIFNATSLQTGALWQFRATAMGGPFLGWTDTGKTRLAQAVAASSAFPPFLSPLYLKPPSLDDNDWHDCVLAEVTHANDPTQHTRRSIPRGEIERYRSEIHLTDGGVRDNLGIAAVQTINRRRIKGEKDALDELISDGGRAFDFEADPAANWLVQGFRVIGITSTEPDLLRIDSMLDRAVSYLEDRTAQCKLYEQEKKRLRDNPPLGRKDPEPSFRVASLCYGGDAAYWGAQRLAPHPIQFHERPDPWIRPEDIATLGGLDTRLTALDKTTQQRLINWGYLSAHYGLSFINRLWQCSQLARLNRCDIPDEKAGIGPATELKREDYCRGPKICSDVLRETTRR
jgi:NTE family protein